MKLTTFTIVTLDGGVMQGLGVRTKIAVADSSGGAAGPRH